MKYIYGALLIVWLAVEQIVNYNTDIYAIASLLGALCLFIIKERYFDSIYTSFVFLFIISALSFYNTSFLLLMGITLVDLAYTGKYIVALLVASAGVASIIHYGNYNYIFHIACALLFAYILGTKDRNEKKHLSLLDEERQLRYNLEKTQNDLIKSRKEIESLTEIRERNRIAHEIHDNIGHSIAGVIFQLEAGIRILHKDIDRTEAILKLCSEKLSEALELTRNTVYNIRVVKKTGLHQIEAVINGFKFCPVDFEHSGDFSSVSSLNLKIMEANIMEALTNASKYSAASKIHIKIDIGKRNIRLLYKDDGIGCSNIKDNLGLSGMRDRVKNAGGVISIDGKDGFLIVCNLPNKKEDSMEVEEA
jgi:signal transduction histidine kinase